MYSDMKNVFKSWSDQDVKNMQFDLPVKGPISSTFGLRRFFNNEERRPHSGLDIAAPTGSQISTPIAGKVAAMGNYFFNVFIDFDNSTFYISKY